MWKHLDADGKIPAGKECPFKNQCGLVNAGVCLHTKLTNPVDFSCSTARGFDRFAQGKRYQVGFLRETHNRDHYLTVVLKINTVIVAELSFGDMVEAQAYQYRKELTTEIPFSETTQRIVDIINMTFELYHIDDAEISVEYIIGVKA